MAEDQEEGQALTEDEKANLERLLAAIGDEFDDIKAFIGQIPNVKRISYDKTNRVPDKFLPALAEEFGVSIGNAGPRSDVQKYLVESTSGSTQQEINYEIWNKVLNSVVYLLKTKGTKEAAEAISRIYGGIHYMPAITYGVEQGEKVGEYVINNINLKNKLISKK